LPSLTALLACVLATVAIAQPSPNPPAIALVDPADVAYWQAFATQAGWHVITPPAANNPDARVLALASAVQDEIKNGAIDPARVYLAGRGTAAASVFYTISRVPDLWAAAIAIEGSPQPAIDTDRIFAANFTNVPVLWVSNVASDEQLAAKLKTAGLNLGWRTSNGLTNSAVLDWLGKHKRDPFPSEIDCETNSPNFSSCYWIRMTKFDPAERNDVLASTKLQPSLSASLDLGGFGYKTGDPGPGILVAVLPDKYSGPLKMGDRLVALDGRPIENVRAYLEIMAQFKEEKPAVATVQRGKERIRVETRVLLPRRDAMVTARVEAQYLPADKEIQIVSRTVKEMRVTIPTQWAPDAKLFWNGLVLEKIDSAACFLLTVDKELLHASKCP
jgi:hypothetical protein